MIATISVVAFVVLSCKNSPEGEEIDFSVTPIQTVKDMFAYQTKNGDVVMRIQAPSMYKYKHDEEEWDMYPDGFNVFTYREDEILETEIKSDKAKHTINTKRSSQEQWMLYGHVYIHNVLKNEVVQTDTLYWDREKEKIYTDCYVKMYSPQGLLQGYGMESDQNGNNAIILRPFDSFTRKEVDSTKIAVDTINFVGPRKKM